MGRTAKPVDENAIEKMASFGCTDGEISAVVGLSQSQMSRRFAKILTKGRADLRERLRRTQIKVALKGNTAMLIFLGKQYLGQSDKVTQENVGADGGPIKIATPIDAEKFKSALMELMQSHDGGPKQSG